MICLYTLARVALARHTIIFSSYKKSTGENVPDHSLFFFLISSTDNVNIWQDGDNCTNMDNWPQTGKVSLLALYL